MHQLFCSREVCVDEGQQLSLAHGCQFYEVSAAESPAGAALAFQALLREARSVQLLRALPIRRKLGVHSVSRVLGTIFGKNTTKDRKKRPSLSIWRLLCALLLGGRDEPDRRTDVIVLTSNVYSNHWRGHGKRSSDQRGSTVAFWYFLKKKFLAFWFSFKTDIEKYWDVIWRTGK